MDREFPVQYCNVGPHRLAYHRAGSGPVVILVHGITTYSFIWDEVGANLSHDFDVIALDLLGCGNSDMPLDVSYSLTEHAARLRTFAESLDLPAFHLVGHDLGGGIAQIFAVKHADMLLDMALLNTVGYDFWPVQPITSLRAPIIKQLLMASLDKGLFRQVVLRGLWDTKKLTPELMRKFMAPLKTATGRKAFLHFARCLDNHNLTDISDSLRRLDLPALIVRGEADRYLPAGIVKRLDEDLPDSIFLRVPQAGHYIQIDQPDLVTASLRKFWSDHEFQK